ncbi:MAG: hypothetical protein LBV05_09310 [Comamonas sp.]|jgi:hypothetical protein|uniref:hypothetical protein n=1 Tax=Comamonas sp. TaxID=34028 RepID=UPI00283C9957|nr:hypothetical protein [Comamonas sp.]MDR3065695.1 hypothetical protein [Comamonas sp.]
MKENHEKCAISEEKAVFDRTAAPVADVAMQKSCATLKDMQTQRAYFFYFWFSPTAAER